MNYILVVGRAFAQYKVGDLITDPVQIAAVEALYGAPYVVRVPTGSGGGPPVPAPPVVTTSDSITIVRDGIPRTVQISDLIAGSVTGQSVSDADCTARATDGYVGFSSLTTGRTVRLPTATSYPPSQTLYVADESGACSPSLLITIAAQGSDTIAGQPSVTMGSPYQKLAFHSNGSNLWTVA